MKLRAFTQFVGKASRESWTSESWSNFTKLSRLSIEPTILEGIFFNSFNFFINLILKYLFNQNKGINWVRLERWVINVSQARWSFPSWPSFCRVAHWLLNWNSPLSLFITRRMPNFRWMSYSPFLSAFISRNWRFQTWTSLMEISWNRYFF